MTAGNEGNIVLHLPFIQAIKLVCVSVQLAREQNIPRTCQTLLSTFVLNTRDWDLPPLNIQYLHTVGLQVIESMNMSFCCMFECW